MEPAVVVFKPLPEPRLIREAEGVGLKLKVGLVDFCGGGLGLLFGAGCFEVSAPSTCVHTNTARAKTTGPVVAWV